MWRVEAEQLHSLSGGAITIYEGVDFKVDNLSEANAIIQMFKKYGVGKHKYSVTQEEEEETNE